MYIHKQQDETPLQRPSTNLHRQKNTLYLESLRYGVILHAKRILKTIEDSSIKMPEEEEKLPKAKPGPAFTDQLPEGHQTIPVHTDGPDRKTHSIRRGRDLRPRLHLPPIIQYTHLWHPE